MRQWIIIIFLLGLVACNSNKDNEASFLSQPPYDALTDSIRIQPGNADLYYRRGALLYKNGLNQEAENDLRKAWLLQPGEEYALSLTTVLKKKNTDSAIAFLSEAIRKIPNSIGLKVGLARGYQQKGQLEKALEICNQVLASTPGELNTLLLKSELLKAMNRDAEALANLEQTYTYAPGDAELAQTLAFTYAEQKDPRALKISDSLISVDVEHRHAEPYYFKGVYYSNTGNPAEAIRQFDEAIRHDINFLDAYVNKAIVYYDQKKYQQALNTLNLAIKVDPTYAESFYWIGKTYEAMGNKEDAKLNYERAYGLDKTMDKAKEKLRG